MHHDAGDDARPPWRSLRVAQAIARDQDRTLSETVSTNRDEELLWDLSDQLGSEDGMIWMYDIDDGQTLAH
jgi:hypothetical protein